MKDIGTEERNTPNMLTYPELEKVVGGAKNPDGAKHEFNNDYKYCKVCKMQTPVRYDKNGNIFCDRCGFPYD